jgi:asparagine N-glycosylation enzyme membrane subunit Stt3
MKSRIALLIALVLILGLSAYVRISLPYKQVIGTNSEVRFTTVDAYAHMQMADWEYDNFPKTMKTNPLLSYPDNPPAPARPLWSWTLALISKVSGIPLDLVATWMPAILGVLLAILAFIIGYLIFNKWAGVIGALFVAVIPGELVGRTSLGHADHDAFEITLLLITLVFIILAVKNKWYWAFVAGIFLGLYNLNWAGSPLFTLILCLYLVVQSCIDRYRSKVDLEFYGSFVITFIVGLLIYVLASDFRPYSLYYVLFYTSCAILPAGLALVLFSLRKTKPIVYLYTLGGIFICGVFVFTVVIPNTGYDVYQSFTAFFPQLTGFGSTISEMMPLFWYRGQLDFVTPWAYYGLCFYTGLIGMIYFLAKNWRNPVCLMVATWSIITMILVVLQRRYGIYSAISMSIYTGYLCWEVVKWVGVRQLTRADRKRGKKPINIGYVVMTTIVLVLFLFVPNYIGTIRTAQQLPYMPSDAWMDGMKWLKNNSQQETKPTYSILSWWDYGYWIAREAKRAVPIHPGGGNTLGMARYLLSTDKDKQLTIPMSDYTNKILTVEETRKYFGVKYIVIDYQMVTGKLYAIPEAAGYTPQNMGDTLIMQLWNAGKTQGFEKVWESSQKYNKDAQLKIFEYKE